MKLFLYSKQKSATATNQIFPKPQTTSSKGAGVWTKIWPSSLPNTNQSH